MTSKPTCGDGRHRPDAVGFCQDCDADCAPELRKTCDEAFKRAHSAESAIYQWRERARAAQNDLARIREIVGTKGHPSRDDRQHGPR